MLMDFEVLYQTNKIKTNEMSDVDETNDYAMDETNRDKMNRWNETILVNDRQVFCV